MDFQQRAYYEAMRRSQDASMRRSSDQNRSPGHYQRASAPTQPSFYHGRDSQNSRDSRGSRGSQEGMRMSGGPEMAGVGIFFQQEPNTGKVYVANIVPGGSADRSGVIRVNDVIVKVDDEDVQGQPLSTLRNLILGRQGSYVVLAFRRMTGSELYYFDVELLRGSPEYFETLKKTQAIADEKEKLITQVRQQEQEIQHLKQTSLRSSGGGISMPLSSGIAGQTLESLNRELQMKKQESKRLEEMLQRSRGNSTADNDPGGLVESLHRENCRMEETLQTTKTGIDQLRKRLEEEKAQQQQEITRMEKQLAGVQRSRANTAGPTGPSLEENRRLKNLLAQRQQRDSDMKRRLAETASALQEALRSSEESTKMLQEVVPGLDALQRQILVEIGR